MKKALSLLLAAVLLFALSVPVLAAEDYAPFTIDSHHWKAFYTGYLGLFTFSAAKVEFSSKESSSYSTDTKEIKTVTLKPGSTITVGDDYSPMLNNKYAAVITGYLSTGEEYWLFLQSGTYTVEEFFGRREYQHFEGPESFAQSGPMELGPFASFSLSTDSINKMGGIDRLQYIITLSQEEAPLGPAVVLSPQKLNVNDVDIDCMKYNIDGSNYFKLRDLAQLLNGTESQFDVGWDAAAGVASITTQHSYSSPDGSELKTGADMSASAVPSSQTIMIDGIVRTDLSVYNIGGSNYFKLRELSNVLGFSVDYDAATDTAIVRSQPIS